MAPRWLIILLFLIAFVVATLQYVQIDPSRRIMNLRFGLMAGATAAAIGYPILDYLHPRDLILSWVFLALAVLWLLSAWRLFRRMPPREMS